MTDTEQRKIIHEIATGTVIMIIFIVGLFVVCVFVDIATCPKCGGAGFTIEDTQVGGITIPSFRLCLTCGGLGKVTVLEWFVYSFTTATLPNINEGEVSG